MGKSSTLCFQEWHWGPAAQSDLSSWVVESAARCIGDWPLAGCHCRAHKHGFWVGRSPQDSWSWTRSARWNQLPATGGLSFTSLHMYLNWKLFTLNIFSYFPRKSIISSNRSYFTSLYHVFYSKRWVIFFLKAALMSSLIATRDPLWVEHANDTTHEGILPNKEK